jgi:hypothetical protein
MKAIFAACEFTPTEFNSCEDKAWFANHFVHFVEAGCPQRLFRKRFYHRLSLCFGHIAHYDIHGFGAEWFSSSHSKAAFFRHTLNYRPIGDPAFTYSDVERAILKYLRASSLPHVYEMDAKAEIEARERHLLSGLKAKYESPGPPSSAPRDDGAEPHALERDCSHPVRQMSLFG